MRKLPYKYLLLLLVALAWCGVNYFGLLDFVEEQTIDWRFQYRGELPNQAKIFYIDMDDKSIAVLGNPAWDRTHYRDVCEAVLKTGGARAIGIDFVFSDRGTPEIADKALVRAGTLRMAEFLFTEPAPPVVLAAGYASAQDRDINGLPVMRALPRVRNPTSLNQPPELPQFEAKSRVYTPPNVGLIDTIDGTMNMVPLFAPAGERTWFNMAVELARLSWGLPPDGLHVHPNRLEFARDDGAVLASVPLLHGQDVEVNWSTRWISPQNPRASFSTVLKAAWMLKSPKETQEARAAAAAVFAPMKDAIVLIGPVDPLLQDTAPTRLDTLPVPRVGLIGNLIRMFTSGQYLWRPSQAVQWLFILALTACVCALQLIDAGRFSVLFKIAAVALVLGYVALAFALFAKTNRILPLVTPVSSALSASFVLTGMLLWAAERMRHRITSIFGTYVSPALVERMIESGEEPQLGGVEAPITAYFSDIQNFTMLAEMLTPAKLVELMNEYLSMTTDVITAQDGTLDKYVGDGVVAMFGAPVPCADHAYRACVATQLVHAQVMEFRTRWKGAVASYPTRTQIGLNTGKAIVGNIGSRTRFNYTMMGDAVNVAARMESAARFFGVSTLVSAQTRAEAERHGDRCVFRYLGKIVVKGRHSPVLVHEIMGLRDQLPAPAMECSRVFAAGLEKFFARDWPGAAELFAKSAPLEWYPVTLPGQKTPSQIYLERCRELLANPPPPPEWTGEFVMHSK